MTGYTQLSGSFHLPISGDTMIGSFTIAIDSFTDINGTFHPASQQVVPVVKGAYSCLVAPNQGSSPAGTYYTVTYQLRNGSPLATDYLSVPVSATPLTLDSVRVNQSVQPLPYGVPLSQITAPTAHVGDIATYGGPANGFVPVSFQTAFPFTFTNQSTIVIPAATHGQGNNLFVQVLDANGYRLWPSVQVNPATGDVTLSFVGSTSGSGFIYGGLGRSLPNYGAAFFGTQSVTISAAQHGFNSPNLAVAVYDTTGNLIDAQSSVQISSNFSVTVYLGSPQNFKVVVLGLVGASNSVLSASSTGTKASPFYDTVSTASTVSVAETVHGKGAQAIAFAFTNDSPAQAMLVDYSRDSSGNLTATFGAPGTLQVVAGGYSAVSSPYVLPVTSASTVSVPVTAHGQGPNALAFAFTNDTPPIAADIEYTRSVDGSIAIAFDPAFTGTVQISAGGWRGSSLYTQPVPLAVTSLSIPETTHGQGTAALPFAFTGDNPAIAIACSYTRDASGNLSLSFNPSFTGTVQVASFD